MLKAIRAYRVEIVRRQRVLARERDQRRATAQTCIAAGADPQLRRGAEAALPRPARPGAPPDRGAPPGRGGGLAARGGEDARAAHGRRPGRRQRHRRREHGRRRRSAPLPAPSSVAASAVASRSASSARPTSPAAPRPGGFDCSGLVSWAYAQAGHPGCRTTPAISGPSGTRIDSTSELAPGDLVFFNGLDHVGMYIGGGQFVEAPHSGDVVKISSLASRSDYLGAVRISG